MGLGFDLLPDEDEPARSFPFRQGQSKFGHGISVVQRAPEYFSIQIVNHSPDTAVQARFAHVKKALILKVAS